MFNINTKAKQHKQAVMMAVVAAIALMAGPAMAVSEFDPLTTAVSFVDVVAAIMAVAAILSGLYVTMRGVRLILGFIRRG